MNKLVFRKIYIFSAGEKQAKCLEFDDGINIISSSQLDGTDRGKSVIMRSLYHTMGADCQFDDKWDNNGKIYILLFSIEDEQYYIYRSCRLFKFFDANKKLLFSTIDRKDLAEKLKAYFGFTVQLPNRSEDKLEVTPPVYNYLPYFIDQDYYNGTDFSSFSGLAQYDRYKENVLYYHFGAFDATYYKILKELECLIESKKQLERRYELVEGMLAKTNDELKGSSFTIDLTALQSEVEMAKEEYSQIVSRLSKVKQHLIGLKNQRYELESALSELQRTGKQNEKDIESLNRHICPLCSSELADTTALRSSKYNTSDDIILVSNDIQHSVLELNSRIDSETDNYKELLTLLEEYELKLNMSSHEVNDVLKHKGFIKVRDSLLIETNELKQSLTKIKEDSDALSKEKQKYNETKKAINSRYYELLLSDKTMFGLSEIDEKRFKNITKKFSASGSNKPIATVMWYMNLIKLKNEFNPDAIKFPIVFDSPNNAETDDVKKHELLAYLLKNATDKNQLIITTIGFDVKMFDQDIQCNVINLTNKKYHLLSESEFTKHSGLLFELCNKQ